MAEVLAGLLTSAVVGIAKDKLASAIADKANFLWNFDDHLEDMMAVLESISAALQDAERRSVKEKLVQLWLKRLKNAALDITDMLELEDYQDTSEQLTGKMAGLLSCLPNARKKFAVASMMKSIREELRKINKEFHEFNFSHGGTTTSVEQLDDDRETSSILPEGPIIGRNAEKQVIIKQLSASTKIDETVIVAVYGLGGMGKSTLAQLVYNDAHLKKDYDHRIWVYVSQDFSLKKIGTSIISQLQLEGSQHNRDTLQVINQCLDNLLSGKKVLIVLDDIWEENDTKLGKLRSMLHVGKKGSMIDVIVTTRNEEIARKISTSRPYKLQPLNDDTCWEIIRRTSKFEHKHNHEKLEQIGMDIAKKCGGVALAAQAVGYMLQSKDLSQWIEISKSDIWNMSPEGDDVLPSLKLSYERMPPQLRICFSYCAIFPKGHNIDADDLIRQWICLGFIKPSEGKQYIMQLLGMSFLQHSMLTSNSAVRYTMHDLVHDLATLIMSGELMVSNVASKSNKSHGHKYCRYSLVTKYDKAAKLSNLLPSKVRALHFSDSDKLDLATGAFSFARCLRILDFSRCSTIQLPASIGKPKQLKYLFAPRIQNEVLPEYITDLAKLQYLNLKDSFHISALPESIGKLAGCLEFLSLSGCSGISKLPASFGDLKCMMHLDMSACGRVKELPDSLGDLTNLQHLQLSHCSSLKAIPESLCGLTQLQYLNLNFCYNIVRLPEAIGCLIHLQYLNMSNCGFRELPKSFNRLGNLFHLELVNSFIEKGLPGALRGLTALQYLDMSSFGHVKNLEKDDLPNAMTNLINLKVLLLKMSLNAYFDVENNDGNLDFLGTLTNLEHLDLADNHILGYLPESIGYLKRLHTLNLIGCKGLKSLPESIGSLKRLHTLNLFCCSGLKSLPESIDGATGLKYLFLRGCSHKVMDKASSLLHYSLTLPLFMVRADDVSGHSNLHQLQGENNIGELDIYSLENVRFVEEARRCELWAKQNLVNLTLSWTKGADRLIEDKDLLGELVPPMSLNFFRVLGYSSPSFPSWFLSISHHFMNLTNIILDGLPNCIDLPPLGQFPCLKSLALYSAPSLTKIDCGFCGGKGAFPQLESIDVCDMNSLEEWNTTYPGEDGVEEFMFPVLRFFNVGRCPRLRLKACPPKCHQMRITSSDQVISSLEEVEASSHYLRNSTPTTVLTIKQSQRQSFRLFHHFPGLRDLSFHECPNLASLPEGIKQISSLQRLILNTCDSMSALPEWLSDISSLKELFFSSCTSIKSFPQSIQQLTNLEKLCIFGNQELQQWCESEENKAKLAHIKGRQFGPSPLL